MILNICITLTHLDEDDDDVIIIGEDKPTAEQIAMARKFLLSDTFYLYENKPPCPGCIGCEDGELPKPVAPVLAAKTSVNKKFKGEILTQLITHFTNGRNKLENI